MKLPRDKYISGEYLIKNPTWDSEDSPWKARLVREILQKSNLTPASICDVGCGAGDVLVEMRRYYPEAELYGYELVPDAASFWQNHERANIRFQVGDISILNKKTYDVILLLDVVEHVADPYTFLTKLRGIAKYFIFHIPLDLSAINILREKPIMAVRENVGHIQYFTKNLALSLVRECGFDILHWQYSGAAFNAPRRTLKTIFASLPRRIVYALDKDLGVRALGGETLIILAKNVDFDGV